MNLDWARQWFDAFNKGHGIEQMLDMYAEEVEFEDIIFGEKFRGKSKLREFFGTLADPAAGKHSFTVESYTGGPEAGAVEWTWHSEHAGPFLGVPAAGKETTTHGVSILTFEGGKIATQHDYWDAAAVLKQLGAL